jgi:hypothetical protein
VIHSEEAGIPKGAGELKPAVPLVEPSLSIAPPPIESIPIITKPAEPIHYPVPEPQPVEKTLRVQSIASEPAIKKKSTTKCPTCQSLIDLPETLNEEWPVELKCGNCGAKCLMKPSFRKQWTNYSI